MTGLARHLDQTIVIERATSGVADDRGIGAQTWATSSTVKGRIRPLSVDEIGELSQAGPVASTHRVLLLPNADVSEADRLTRAGKTYQIDSKRDPGGASDHWELDAHLVTGT